MVLRLGVQRDGSIELSGCVRRGCVTLRTARFLTANKLLALEERCAQSLRGMVVPIGTQPPHRVGSHPTRRSMFGLSRRI